MKIQQIRQLCPMVHQATIVLGGRVQDAAFKEYVEQLSKFSRLKELDLVFKSSLEPKYATAQVRLATLGTKSPTL